MNSYHNDWLDIFFIYFTWLGDGLISIVAVIILAAFKKLKPAITLLLAYITSGIVCQILKHLYNHPRPKLFFDQYSIDYEFIEGVTLYSENSFPSGHSATAFTMATVLALIYNDKRIGLLALLVAALAAYSRIYLGQHFLEDVTAGAFIGLFFGMLCFYATTHINLPDVKKVFKRKNDQSISAKGDGAYNA